MSEVISKENFYAQISALLLDDKFRALKQKKNFNIFDVLKIARTEIRHSNMLAWLLDPNEDHGLGSKLLNEFVLTLIRDGHIFADGMEKFLLAKYEDVTIYRERKNIDILIESAKDKFVICIENKVDTKDHSGQLKKYEKSVHEDYENYQKVFVYLTPSGDQPTEETDFDWACLDYASISGCIEKATRNAPVSDKVRDFVQYYQEILRREIMGGDAEIKRICSEVYRQHKAVLDLIYEYRPDDVQNISDIVVEWCKKKEAEGEIFYQAYSANQSKCYCRFRNGVMDRMVEQAVGKKVENRQSGWKGENQYFYEIVLGTDSNGDVTYGLKFTVCSDHLTETEKEALGEIYSGVVGSDVGKWKVWKSTTLKTEKILATESALEDREQLVEEICKKIDAQWNALQKNVMRFAKERGLA
jgi:hypothetical protein